MVVPAARRRSSWRSTSAPGRCRSRRSLALLHDLVITVGLYARLGFEITPAAVIGFLTILGYSLYDTVVVFDKIRENTAEDGPESRRTFAESVNLAVNQTLVRSINTSVVAALPVASILFIGAFVLGADTLRDISLALLDRHARRHLFDHRSSRRRCTRSCVRASRRSTRHDKKVLARARAGELAVGRGARPLRDVRGRRVLIRAPHLEER